MKKLALTIISAMSMVCFDASLLLAENMQAQSLSETVTSFTGKAQNRNILLSWNTLAEHEQQQFVVQRSIDGFTWNDLSVVRGTGGSLWPVSYCFADTTVSEQSYYYRIKIQLDKEVDYTAGISVRASEEQSENTKFQVYPNPTKNVVWIKSNHDKNFTPDLIIYNSMGEQVYATKVRTPLVKIDLVDYKKGYYYVKVGEHIQKLYKE